MYFPAALFFLATILAIFIPLSTIIIMITSGLSGFYFYTKKLNNDLNSAGINEKSLEDVKKNLSKLGGYNNWVIFLAIVLYSII